MSEPAERGRGVVAASLFVALCLTILPMPAWAVDFRPQWVALTLLYWTLTRPQQVGVFWAFGAGLAMDVSTGAVIGAHALSLSVLAWLTIELNSRIRPFPPWQQALPVWLILLVERLLSLWIIAATGAATPGLEFWLPTVVGMLLWPWFYGLFRRIGERAGRVARS